jgi:hypothetical protein
MKGLVDLVKQGVKSISPYGDKGVHVSFDDDTNLWVEHNLDDPNASKPEISLWGTSKNGGTSTRLVLDTFTLTKVELVIQELTVIAERLKANT